MAISWPRTFREKEISEMKLRLAGIATWWLWMPLVGGIYWLFLHFVVGGVGTWERNYELWLQRQFFPGGLNILHASPLFWLMMFIGFTVTAIILILPEDDSGGRRSPYSSYHDKPQRDTSSSNSLLGGAFLLSVIIAIGSLVPFQTIWWADKDAGRYNVSQTVFFTPTLNPDDPKVPDAMKELLIGARKSSDPRCDLVGKHDVKACIKQGTLGNEGWEPRPSSLSGAQTFLRRPSGGGNGTRLLTETTTYVYNTNGQPGGVWTAIRDVQPDTRRTPIYGVATWAGKGEPRECTFRKGYSINRAFFGSMKNSMSHYIAERYQDRLWDVSDMWGYCDASDKPVIVVPLKKQVRFANRTMQAAAGILVVRGSASGDPRLDLFEDVKANQVLPEIGKLGGPVYPASLVKVQREESAWAAGRRIKDQSAYGFDPSDMETQKLNPSEYLLRGAKDGRLYWVTPLTPKGDSDVQVAYAVSRADEVTTGSLNQLNLYGLAKDDSRRKALQTIDVTVKEVLRHEDGTFLNTGGAVVEYIPMNPSTIQVYAERSGQPIYVMRIPLDKSVTPTIAQVTGDGSVGEQREVPWSVIENRGTSVAGNPVCARPTTQMTEQELTTCLSQFGAEYGRRHPVKTPQPSGSAQPSTSASPSPSSTP